jgi:hypothetical protein
MTAGQLLQRSGEIKMNVMLALFHASPAKPPAHRRPWPVRVHYDQARFVSGHAHARHIHYVVNAPGFKQRIFEIVFAGDPLVDQRIRARAAEADSGFSLCPLTRDAQGVLRCSQDIQLKK